MKSSIYYRMKQRLKDLCIILLLLTAAGGLLCFAVFTPDGEASASASGLIISSSLPASSTPSPVMSLIGGELPAMKFSSSDPIKVSSEENHVPPSVEYLTSLPISDLSAPVEDILPEETPSSDKPNTEESKDDDEETKSDEIEKTVSEITIRAEGGGKYLGVEGVWVKNNTGQDVDLAYYLKRGLAFNIRGDEPQVLIIHTHGSEAYANDPDDPYEPSDYDRTLDKNYNVIRVGDALEEALTEAGVKVIHDRGIYDYPTYTGSYTRSLEAIAGYMKEAPSIKIIIDLHRDAMETDDGLKYKPVAMINGEKAAQVMLIVGTDVSGLPHDSWREKFKFA